AAFCGHAAAFAPAGGLSADRSSLHVQSVRFPAARAAGSPCRLLSRPVVADVDHVADRHARRCAAGYRPAAGLGSGFRFAADLSGAADTVVAEPGNDYGGYRRWRRGRGHRRPAVESGSDCRRIRRHWRRRAGRGNRPAENTRGPMSTAELWTIIILGGAVTF